MFRKWIAWTSAAPLPFASCLEQHVARCPHCRSSLQAERELTGKLTALAETHCTEAPPHLHARILARLDADRTTVFEDRPAWPWLRPLASVGALAGLALLAGYLVSSRERAPASVPPVLAESDWNAEALRGWTEKLDQPLERELYLIVSDAKTAIKSLQESFLPDTRVAANDR